MMQNQQDHPERIENGDRHSRTERAIRIAQALGMEAKPRPHRRRLNQRERRKPQTQHHRRRNQQLRKKGRDINGDHGAGESLRGKPAEGGEVECKQFHRQIVAWRDGEFIPTANPRMWTGVFGRVTRVRLSGSRSPEIVVNRMSR